MRRSALLLLPFTALALAACGSDGSSSPDPSLPVCTQVPTPSGTEPTPAGKVLCVGIAGVSPLGTDGGVVRIAVTDVSRAPAAALAGLDIGTANGEKEGATLWYVTVEATIAKSSAALRSADPAGVISLSTAGGDDGKSYVSGAPDGCERSRFTTSDVGSKAVSCAWTLLPEGEQPGEVSYAGDYGTTPTLRWAAQS